MITLIALIIVAVSIGMVWFLVKKKKNGIPLKIWYRSYFKENKVMQKIKYPLIIVILLSCFMINFGLFILVVLVSYIIYYFYIKEKDILENIDSSELLYRAVVNNIFMHHNGIKRMIPHNQDSEKKEDNNIYLNINPAIELKGFNRESFTTTPSRLYNAVYTPNFKKQIRDELKILNEEPIANKFKIQDMTGYLSMLDEHAVTLDNLFDYFASDKHINELLFYRFSDGTTCEVLSGSIVKELDRHLLEVSR